MRHQHNRESYQIHPTVASSISEKSEHQTCEYDAWGYPLAIPKLSAKYEEEGHESPELIYTRGYPGFLTTPWGATDFAALRLSFCSF